MAESMSGGVSSAGSSERSQSRRGAWSSAAAVAAELSYVDLDGWSEGDEEGKK
jgi:hypothetical protein